MARGKRSAEAESWQGWYKTKRWQRLRAKQLRQHRYCQCPLHEGKRVLADTVDHKVAHKGNARLFWNPRNLQSLTRHCHDSHKQRQERSGILRGARPDGTPIDPNHPWNRES